MRKQFLVFILSVYAFIAQAQFTDIPDAHFEQALINLGIDTDPILDGQVLTKAIDTIKTLDVSNEGILNLSGIEDFKSLESFNCSGNAMSTLELSQLPVLTRLVCGGIELENIDVTGLQHLRTVILDRSKVKRLNLSKNTGLRSFTCNNTRIDSMFFAPASSLRSIELNGQVDFKYYDFVNCPNLDSLLIYKPAGSPFSIDIQSLISLKFLFSYHSGLMNLDFSKNTLLETLICPNNNLTELDLSNNPNLVYLDCGDHTFDHGPFNYIKSLDLSNNTKLETLNCNHISLEELDIRNCTRLKILRCSENPLDSLDTSQNTYLEELDCANTARKGLDLLNNTKLRKLNAQNRLWFGRNLGHKNEIEYLDLSDNVDLRDVDVSNIDALTTLNVKNGNNQNMNINADLDSALNCVIVDSADSIPSRWKFFTPPKLTETAKDCERPTATVNNDKEDIQCEPNPFYEQLRITSNEDVKYSIVNIHGLTLLSGKTNSTIETTSLIPGIYYVVMEIDGGMTRSTVITKQ